MRSIGWLGRHYGLQGTNSTPMAAADLNRLRSASWRLGSIMLGTHECDFCPEGAAFEGNGEYRYYMANGDVYAAPMMILHYTEQHGYRPPETFTEALREERRLEWDWRAEQLSDALLNESEDLDFRCEAIIDLANWRDPRALHALRCAARDEVLVDVTGDEIGRSLGLLLSCEFARDLPPENFPDGVMLGIDQGRSLFQKQISQDV